MGVSLDLRMLLLPIGNGCMIEGENSTREGPLLSESISVAWLVRPCLLEF